MLKFEIVDNVYINEMNIYEMEYFFIRKVYYVIKLLEWVV